MRLLARNAESLFWLARYLERGASLARVVEMQSSFGGQASESGWSWLLALHTDEERFKERLEPTAASIIAFYVTDSLNPGSIRSSIHWARENARALRPFIPLEMWVQFNAFHAQVEEIGEEAIEPAELPRTCAAVRAGCLAQIGVAEGTLYRDEGYLFFMLGLMVERADQTSRLLDVKFAQMATAGRAADTGDDFVFWSAILRSAAAYQVFRRHNPSVIEPEQVARFLLLNAHHPRSIGYCAREITDSLQQLRGAFHLSGASAALEHCELLMDGLQAAGRDPALLDRLHDVNEWVQLSLMKLTDTIASRFFRRSVEQTVSTTEELPPVPVGGAGGGAQSQSQS